MNNAPIRRFTLVSWLSIYGRSCYEDFVKESDYATLERELAAAQVKLKICIDALEAAPSPICIAGEPNHAYDSPHTVRNFADVDHWWVITRSTALDIALGTSSASPPIP